MTCMLELLRCRSAMQYTQDLEKPVEERIFAAAPALDEHGQLNRLVLCPPHMASAAIEHAHKSVWIVDATFGTNAYNYSLFTCMAVHNTQRSGIHTGFVIARDDSVETVQAGMSELVEHIRRQGEFKPSVVMEDCCQTLYAVNTYAQTPALASLHDGHVCCLLSFVSSFYLCHERRSSRTAHVIQ